MTTVRNELTTDRAEANHGANIQDVQHLVMDLAQRIEDANVNSEMPLVARQQLADHIGVVVVGAFHMLTLNTEALLESVAGHLNVGITQIMVVCNVMGTVIDEEGYREFERDNLVGRYLRKASALRVSR